MADTAPQTIHASADLPFEALSATHRRFMHDLLGLHGIDVDRFCLPLPRADEMFFKGLLVSYEQDPDIAAFKFVESTLRFFDTYRQIVDQMFGGFENLTSVMDFASGYGRLTRVLVQRLAVDQIWASDIYADAMAWQSRVLGVNTFVSTPHPSALDHDRTHDIVFVGSLFSHLPTGLFEGWLARLYRMVGDGGVLAFSVHDQSFLPAGETLDASGLSYFRVSESGSLDHDIYGMSYVSEAYVAAAIADLPGAPAWRRFAKGAYENQDLYVVAGPNRDLSGLHVASTPMGGFETATTLTNGDVEFAGWAIERTVGAKIERLRLWVDGVERAVVTPMGERLDVLQNFPGAANTPVGWRFRLGRETTTAGAMIRVDLESGSGLTGRMYAELPPKTLMTYSGWSRRPLRGGGL